MKRLQMKSHGTTGTLITFCGLDGCGKTTMIKLLKEKLEHEGEKVYLTKQPTSHVRQSKMFRTYMDEENHEKYDYHALSLLAASDRVQHCAQSIFAALNRGETVICDRYFYSCLANLRARGYTREKWIYEVSKWIPKPDLAFFLDVPVEVAIARVRERPEEKERYIDEELQHRLEKEYKTICRKNSGISIPANQGIVSAFEEIKAIVDDYRKRKVDYEKD